MFLKSKRLRGEGHPGNAAWIWRHVPDILGPETPTSAGEWVDDPGVNTPERSSQSQSPQERFRRLIDIGTALLSELDLEAVLRSVVEAARELTSAEYAALGVLDNDRQGARALHLPRDRRRDETRDRQPSPRARRAGGADPRAGAAATARRQRAPPRLRVPAGPPADAHLPRGPDHGSRRDLRQSLHDREAGRRRVRRGRRGGGEDAGDLGRGRDRERPPLHPAERTRGRGASRRCAVPRPRSTSRARWAARPTSPGSWT